MDKHRAGQDQKPPAMPDPVETLSIVNVVGSTTINQEIDLEELAKDHPESEYDPDNFPGLIYRHDEPSAACLVFRSGQIVCTGATSIADTERVVQHFLDKLDDRELAVPDDLGLTIQNIVTNGDLGQPLNLSAIAVGLGLEAIEYEPELFPGLVYRMSEPDVVSLLFGSGELVIAGATEIKDAEQALRKIDDELSDLGLLGP